MVEKLTNRLFLDISKIYITYLGSTFSHNMELFLKKICGGTGFSYALFNFFDIKTQLEYKTSDDYQSNISEKTLIEFEKNILNGKEVLYFYSENKTELSDYDLKSLIVLPVKAKKDVVGFLLIESKEFEGTFVEKEIEILRNICDFTGEIYINNNLHVGKIAKKYIVPGRKKSLEYFNYMQNAVIMYDENNKVIDANPLAVSLTGYQLEELKNMEFTDLVSDTMKEMASDRLTIVRKENYLTGEILFKTKEGEDIFVALESILLEDGTIVDYITDLRHWITIVESLSQSEYKFKKIFDLSPIGKEFYNLDETVERINVSGMKFYGISERRELLKWNLLKETIISKHKLKSIKKGDLLKIYHSVNWEDIKSKYGFNTTNTGNSFVELIITDMRIIDKNKYKYFFQIRDITGRKKYIQSLEEENRNAQIMAENKMSFIANMSHEIRTPLNTIIGMSELLTDTELNSTQQKYIDLLNKASDYLYSLINDILDVSKLDSGKINFERNSFVVKDIIDDIVELFSLQTQNHHLNINTVFSDDIPEFLCGDTYRLRQVIFNLLGNAIKFTEEGNIDISVFSVSQNGKKRYIFSVCDSGIGISDDKMDVIFTPFIQENDSTTRKYGGTGLGLSICEKIINMQGGNIWVVNNRDKGATFFFVLDFEKSDFKKVENLKDVVEEEVPENISSVLIIDDTLENRFLMKTYLKKAGIEVVEAESGLTGLEIIKQKKFDCILLDIQMPGLNGFEVLSEIRNLEKKNVIEKNIVIAVTAADFEADINKISISDFDDFIGKPIKKIEFLKKIASIIKE